MLRCVLIDDLPHCTDDLASIIASHAHLAEVVGVAHGVSDAVALIRTTRPDVIFLDVDLNPGTGFDVLDQLDSEIPTVVFVSASEHHALRAIKASAIDYLVKPVHPDEFAGVLGRCRELVESRQQLQRVSHLLAEQKRDEPLFLVVPQQRETRVIPIADIIAAEGDSNYTRFYLRQGEKFLASMTLKDTEDVVGLTRFLRCHKSWLVNVQHIKSLRGGEQPVLSLHPDFIPEVPVSRRRYTEVLERLKTISGNR